MIGFIDTSLQLLLLKNLCVANLSEEFLTPSDCLECRNELPFTRTTATRLEYKSPCRTVNCPLYSVCCHENVFDNIRCRGNRC
jgi:hypothetical protein